MRIPSTIALFIALMLVMGCVLQTPGAETTSSPGQDSATTAAGATPGQDSATTAAGATPGQDSATTAAGATAGSQSDSTSEPPATPTIVSARQASRTQYSSPPSMALDSASNYVADFRTSLGNFRVELLATQTPVTVNNFVFLARQGFYNGTIFHRVIENFMIQGGDPTGIGAGNPGYRFRDEIVPGLVFDAPGKLAMANGGPHTNGSQFFITTVTTRHLDEKHTIFGVVADGQQVVDAISRVNTGARDVPLQQVVLERIDIIQTPRE